MNENNTYDALNRLIAKTKDGAVEYRLLYSGQLTPVAKVDADGGILEQYVYGLGVNSPDYIVKGDRKYRLVKDHLGSVRLVVDTHDGAVVKRLDYDVSGMVIGESGDFDLLFGFAGGFRDTDTGLTKFGARWYDPETGRWTSKEPLGFNGSSNFYTYAHNDPVNFIDPTGLWEKPTHKEITEIAMKKLGLSEEYIKIAAEANMAVDVLSNQWLNYLHFMPLSNVPFMGGNLEDSMGVISSNLEKAIELGKAGRCPEAMKLLGEGLHTLQDYFSHWLVGAGWAEHAETPSPDDVGAHFENYKMAITFSETYVEAYLEGL